MGTEVKGFVLRAPWRPAHTGPAKKEFPRVQPSKHSETIRNDARDLIKAINKNWNNSLQRWDKKESTNLKVDKKYYAIKETTKAGKEYGKINKSLEKKYITEELFRIHW